MIKHWRWAAFLALDILFHRTQVLGLYADDWDFAWRYHVAGNIWSFVKGMATSGLMTRPGQVALNALTYPLAAWHPWAPQILLCALSVTEAWLFYRFLTEFTDETQVATWAAVLILAHPARSATYLWPSNMPQLAAHCLTLGGLLIYDKTTWGRWGGPVLYLSALLTYEDIAFLPWALFAVLVLACLRLRINGARVVVDFSWVGRFGLAAFLGFAWQRWVYPSPKTVAPTARHAFTVYLHGAGGLIGEDWWYGRN